ncbi:MAG: histidinol dehydrogenase [Ferruginibacter sp.]
MKIISFPNVNEWTQLCLRPETSFQDSRSLVQNIFSAVGQKGDAALTQYTKEFDGVTLKNLAFKVPSAEIKINAALKNAITQAKKNIEKFHRSQVETIKKINTAPGITCWRESRAIEKVGLYIPGGSAPLFSTLLMLAIPARIAGCKEIIICTPPQKNGRPHPVIIYTAQLLGIERIFTLGGMQAIAALTLGTESVPKVDKIFGPGNQYVMAAKQEAQQYVAVDMPAGPSEVLVIADDTAVPEFIAADLLAQAEHGPDSQVILLTTKKRIADAVSKQLKAQLAALPRQTIAEAAIENSKIIVLKNLEDCFSFSNQYAPEHLIIAVKNASDWLSSVQNAGSVFMGNYACESVGDYASGTNHTLPTNGFAKSYSGVSVDSFVKKITFQTISKKGLENIGNTVEVMAAAEGLQAHKNAVSIRLKNKVQ